ncbi:MAG: hypothetical protein KJ893_01895 [Candidatus Omnitrophica bacterium]|nr:hypothetical protein [Candidatus Omnitrophota bacterium]
MAANIKKKVKRHGDDKMIKKHEKQIVEIAEGEINKFIKKWIKTPYAWESETDVHAELYMNIKRSLHKKGFKPIKCKYKNIVDAECFDGIYCKPTTYFKKANYPDIVIYKGTDKKYKLGDRENEEMLWVCEIKYFTDWSSSLYKESVENDIRKLKHLLSLKEKGTDYATYLILQRTKNNKRGLSRVLCHDLKLNKNNKIRGILKKAQSENSKLKLYCYSTGYK